MLKYSYGVIERAVRGKVQSPSRRKLFSGNVSTDTRTIQEGDLFIAIKGENVDGHKFIDEAFDKGARLVISEYKSSHRIKRKQGDVIFVDDSVQAMGRLAAFHRRQFDIPVIAVTGSCGKTTTKEIIAHILGHQYKVLKNIGTENNHIGVPKTLLQLDDHEVAVVEIGTNRTGEVYHLSRIVNPTHAVLTMIGNAHLSGFRNVEGVRREKLSMIEALDNSAKVVINGDDKNISHSKLQRIKCIRAGFSKCCDYKGINVELMDEGARFSIQTKRRGAAAFSTSLLGRHNILNILLAVAAVNSVGINKAHLKKAIATFTPPKGRIRYQEINGVHWIDDSYNSNPTSLKAAIELFKVYPHKGRKILAVGDMLELGPKASLFHREAGQSIAEFPFDVVITVGKLSREMRSGAIEKGFDKNKIKSFSSSARAALYITNVIRKYDTLLLKGSRGIHMEKILDHYVDSVRTKEK